VWPDYYYCIVPVIWHDVVFLYGCGMAYRSNLKRGHGSKLAGASGEN